MFRYELHAVLTELLSKLSKCKMIMWKLNGNKIVIINFSEVLNVVALTIFCKMHHLVFYFWFGL